MPPSKVLFGAALLPTEGRDVRHSFGFVWAACPFQIDPGVRPSLQRALVGPENRVSQQASSALFLQAVHSLALWGGRVGKKGCDPKLLQVENQRSLSQREWRVQWFQEEVLSVQWVRTDGMLMAALLRGPTFWESLSLVAMPLLFYIIMHKLRHSVVLHLTAQSHFLCFASADTVAVLTNVSYLWLESQQGMDTECSVLKILHIRLKKKNIL